MAVDARIQKIEELAAYSNHLGSFIESMSKNFTSFNHVMMQKLQVLRQQRRKVEEIEREEAPVEHNFWFESETPDALNELPDLTVSNDNFFANNNIPDLNFPDLKLNFGSNEEENK